MSWLKWLDKLAKKEDVVQTQIMAKDGNGVVSPLAVESVNGELCLKVIDKASHTNVEKTETKSNKAAMLDALDYDIEVKEAPYRVVDVDKNGRIYAAKSHYIKYSDDDGKNWTGNVTNENMIPTIRRLIALDNGDVIIMSTSGAIWKSDSTLTNWREVLADVGGTGFDEGGFSAYENIVLATNYGSDNEFLYAWISTDYGDTWENILQANPPVTWNHMHCIAFDPYENLIWACNGDDYDDYNGNVSRIWYTADFGQHWESISGCRATAIIPLPDRVLFVSDVMGRKSVFSHERPKRGTNIIRGLENRPTNTLDAWGFIDTADYKPPYGIKEVFFAQINETETSATTWGSIPYVQYGKNHMALFGYRTAADINKPIVLWGTTNGEDFVAVWSSRKNVHGGYGIGGVFGNTDKIVAAVALPNDAGDIVDHMLILRTKTEQV